ncbi:MAG: serine hydrolase domain-containing protein [Gemmatimonadota bacterium]
MYRAVLSVMLLASVGTSRAPGQRPASRARLIAVADSLAKHELATGPTAGLAIAVWQRGRLVLARGYGYANLEDRIPITAATVFNLGSVTKQFTATAILQLAEQRKLSLDDELTKYVPELPLPGHRVTLLRLLNHTSGIKNFTEIGGAVDDSLQLDLPPERVIRLFEHEPFDFEPGTDWLYNNSAFWLLGLVVERASGESYGDYLSRHIFAPLGMRSSSFCRDRTFAPPRARGYERTPSGLANLIGESVAVAFSSGGLCSSVLDLVTFRRALGSGRLISKASYRRMIEPTALPNGWRTNYGFGLARYRLGRAEVIRHGGSIGGFQANLMYVPEVDLVVAALANTAGADPVGVSDRIATAAMGLPLPILSDRPLEPQVAARVAGRYRLGGLDVDVLEKGAELEVRRPGYPAAARLVWQGGSKFIARGGGVFGYYGYEPVLDIPIGEARITRFRFETASGEWLTALRMER